MLTHHIATLILISGSYIEQRASAQRGLKKAWLSSQKVRLPVWSVWACMVLVGITWNDEEDAELAKKLAADEKENAEHVMLVDLARNDLSRHGNNVKVEKYREIQFFSHVIHLVSKVTGTKDAKTPTMQVVADTFPAGTLSGAPKHSAMKLIEKYENVNRDAYGGAIGFMDFHGNFNHAIIIRSFVSKDHQLHYQAGAGVVSESVEENELQEVYNKLGALTKALDIAEDI